MNTSRQALNQSLLNIDNRNIYQLPKSVVLLIDKTLLVSLFEGYNDIAKIPQDTLEILRGKINPKANFSKIVVFDVCDKLDQIYLKYFEEDIITGLLRIKYLSKDDELVNKANEYLNKFNKDNVDNLIISLELDGGEEQKIGFQETLNIFREKVDRVLNNLDTLPEYTGQNITVTEFGKITCYIGEKKVKLDSNKLLVLLQDIFNINRELFINNIKIKDKGYFITTLIYELTQDLSDLENKNHEQIGKLSKKYGINTHDLEKIVIYKGFYTKKIIKNGFIPKGISEFDISEENIAEIEKYLEENTKKDLK